MAKGTNAAGTGKRKRSEGGIAENARIQEQEEEDFPRGGAMVLTHDEIKEVQAQADADFERELKEGNKKQKGPQVLGNFKEKISRTKLLDSVPMLTFKKLAVGMKIWGAIAEINNKDLVVNLPDGLCGFVKAEDACGPLGESIELETGRKRKRKIKIDGKENCSSSLKELFHVGQLVICTITGLEHKQGVTGKKESKRIILSLHPGLLYGGLTIEHVSEGMVMVARVRSIEDHGYILSFGISSISGFLLHQNHGDSESRLQRGQLVQGVVLNVDKKRSTVSLSTDPRLMASNTLKEDEGLSLGTLLPGMMVNATVHSVTTTGLVLSFLTYFTGTVDLFHLEETLPGKEWMHKYAENQKVKARILFVDASSKLIGLTLNKSLMQPMTGPVHKMLGELFHGAIVRRVDRTLGILIELPTNAECKAGYAHISDVSDERTEKLEKKFSAGKKVVARVIGFRLMDGLVSLSLKESAVKRLLLSRLDIKTGMLIEGTVKDVHSFGALVLVSDGIKAICPLKHMSEYERMKPSAKFKVGVKLKFRVLDNDIQTKRITLTHKKSLVSSKLPQLTSYEDATEGLVTHGWISGIQDYGCFITFYNNVGGLVYKTELGIDEDISPSSVFRLGQVVKCKVLKSDGTRKLPLSFLTSPSGIEDLSTEQWSSWIKPGCIVSGKITELNEQSISLVVTFSEGSFTGSMVYEHLADFPGHVELLKSSLKPGHMFDPLLVLERRGKKLMVSAKYSLIAAANYLPLNINQLQLDSVIHGYIANITDKGCFVRFLGSLTGYAPAANVSDAFVRNPSDYFQIGQSVRAKVLKVNEQDNKFALSLKQSDCFSVNTSFLQGYFLEEEKIAELSSDGPNLEWSTSFPIGSTVEGTVQDIKDYGVIINLKGHEDVVGFATHYQVGGPIEVGKVIKARVLDVVKADGIVDLSLRLSGSQGQGSFELQLHQKLTATVELVKDEYLVLSFPDYGSEIGFASTHDFNMQVVDPHRQYTPGRRVEATIHCLPGQESAGRLLLLLAGPSSSKGNKRREPQKVLEKKRIIEGGLVTAKVDSIDSLYMNVRLGKNIFGKVHVSEVTDDFTNGNPFSQYHVGDKVEAKVLKRVARKKKIHLELSLRPSHVLECIEKETAKVKKEDSSSKHIAMPEVGQVAVAYVQEVNDEWAWLALGPHLRGRLFILDSSTDPVELRSFRDRFQVGTAVQCRVLRFNHEKGILDLSTVKDTGLLSNGPKATEIDQSGEDSGFDKQCPKKGSIVGGRISQILAGIGGLRVQLAPRLFGRVHVTELGDVWSDYNTMLFKEGEFVGCRVLNVSKNFRGATVVDLSLRPSLGGSGGFEKLLPEMPPQIEKTVPRLQSISDVTVGMEVQGFVKDISRKGCFVTLSQSLDAKILLSELSNKYIEDPCQSFSIGKMVKGRILNVEPLSGRIEMTLKSTTNGDLSKALNMENLLINDILSGAVRRVEPFGIFVNLEGTDIVGMCHVSEISDEYIEDIQQAYKPGQVVTAKILKVDKGTSRVYLGMKESYLRTATVARSNIDVEVAAELDAHEFNNSVLFDPHEDTSGAEDIEAHNLDNHEPSLDLAVPPLEVDLEDFTTLASPIPPEPVDEMHEDKKKEHSKHSKKRVKEEREAAIRIAEAKALADDHPPENVDDFEKLVRASPNSSIVWIKYIEFLVARADINTARGIAERALETINFREEKEKRRIWKAYLNLENDNGSKEAVLQLFQRGLSYCDPKSLYLDLLDVYENKKQQDMADQLLKTMAQKFRSSTKVCLRRIQNFLQNGSEESAHKFTNKSLSTLPAHKHIKFISHVGIMEFKMGSVERGRSLFDGILKNYPKRTDLWMVYIDQEIRVGDSATIRALFERVICLELPPKRMMSFFKKYLKYEMDNKDEARIEHVKSKAREYAETKLE